MLEDSAGTVDTKFGKQYGDYARSAASTVAGLASTLDQKDLDELAGTTRDFVKQSPAVARSEERRVGKEHGSTGRSQWWQYHETKKRNRHKQDIKLNMNTR